MDEKKIPKFIFQSYEILKKMETLAKSAICNFRSLR